MADREKVIKELEETKEYIRTRSNGSGSKKCRLMDACNAAIILLKEQEAKTGYWIDSAGNDKCSICGAEYSDLYPDYGNTHFCPNCGAKMKGQQNE